MLESRPKKQRRIKIAGRTIANDAPAYFIAGMCSFETPQVLAKTAKTLKTLFAKSRTPWIFKCSFDKANRSSVKSYRGRGIGEALEMFAKIKDDLNIPMITDIHEPYQAEIAAKVVDMLQIPAFLCRQTDLLVAAGRTGKAVNIKKGQFLSPWDMTHAVGKVESTGNKNILLTERGSSFGYKNLVVDMRSLEIMARTGYPVIFDATHACQLPGGLGSTTDGQREFAPILANAAAAIGIAGFSMETHPNPEKAKSDGPNSLRLKDMARVVRTIQAIDRLTKGGKLR
jgi:2-dehydro-3-deoxyphosphooctonate aldolase (KDO 8-P synthase)